MAEDEDFYVGHLYKEDNFPLSWLVKKVLSKVELADEYVEALRKLAERGVVVYAIKNKSQLNSLIIRELSARRGIPRPVYCHGFNMVFWQPFPALAKVVLSSLSRWFFKKTIPDVAKKGYLKEDRCRGEKCGNSSRRFGIF